MAKTHLSIKKVAELYGGASVKNQLLDLEARGEIPPSEKFRSGAISRKGWRTHELGQIGEKVGFFPKFEQSCAIAVFTTKGGVLKTFTALNLARVAALHNLRTCVVGLDIQGDITTALGHDHQVEENEALETLIEKLNRTKGLADFFNGNVRLEEIVYPTDLPQLFFIPETPEMVAFNEGLSNINRREYWLKEKIIDPLREKFDFIVMDCSPNWNRLTTNALVAADALVSPLECKINNFRNFRVFGAFLKEFHRDMKLDFSSIFVPTRYSQGRKLSMEIKDWYQNHVEGCTKAGIRESVYGEEATALNLSLLEHVPGQNVSMEMIELFKEIHARLNQRELDKIQRPPLSESTYRPVHSMV